MKKLYCWRCKKDVIMLDEAEFEQFSKVYMEGIRATKKYRKDTGFGLREALEQDFMQPAVEKFEEITGTKVDCSVDHLRKHRLSDYGDPCRKCGKPLRTPQARFCAACGERV